MSRSTTLIALYTLIVKRGLCDSRNHNNRPVTTLQLNTAAVSTLIYAACFGSLLFFPFCCQCVVFCLFCSVGTSLKNPPPARRSIVRTSNMRDGKAKGWHLSSHLNGSSAGQLNQSRSLFFHASTRDAVEASVLTIHFSQSTHFSYQGSSIQE